MANWYGSSRTNYVKITDVDAMKAWIDRFEVQVVEGGMGTYAFLAQGEDGSFPCFITDPETDEEREIDFGEELMQFVDPESVLVVQEVGAEKLRYLTGWATAYAWQEGKLGTCSININDIYDEADRRFGKTSTEAVY